MRALIWKEGRENLRWAALALVVGGLLWWYTLHIPPWPDSVMNRHVQLWLSGYAAAVAALLGGLQAFREAHGDRRALLLHRPLSRSRIFLAKVVTGLGLYFLALGLPFMAAVAWAATPGHVAAPFRWPMALPGVADILTGGAYYFAAMLTVQREARWYGSRGLGLVAAFAGSVLVWVMPEFWHALLVIAAFTALTATAAWGSFLTGGAYAPQPGPSRAALTVTLLLGVLVAGFVVVMFPVSLFARRDDIRQELTRDGRLLTISYENGRPRRVTDLDGRELPELQGKRLDVEVAELRAPMVTLYPWTAREHHYREYQRLFLLFDPRNRSYLESWFYVLDQRRLLGYDRESNEFLGSIGPAGFTPPGQEPGPDFAGELRVNSWSFQDLVFPDVVYTVDLPRRAVRPFFTPGPGEHVLFLQWWNWWDRETKPGPAFVLTDRAVHVLAKDGTPRLSAPLAYDLAEYGLVQALELKDGAGYVFWYRHLDRGFDRSEWSSYLVTYDAAGRQVARRTVPPPPAVPPSWGYALFGLVTPPAGFALFCAIFYLTTGLGPPVPAGLLGAYAGLLLLSAAACALACGLLARRYAFARAGGITWALLGFLFGPAGLLAMIAVQEWPARVPCPACRRPRVVTRNTCEHCDAAHAPPAADGTEIFETAPEPTSMATPAGL